MTALARPGALGIDVVDLDDRRFSDKAGDIRFVRRVFTTGEAGRIRASVEPDLALAIHWAVKEAVFKAESCALGEPPVFAHADFEFMPEDEPSILSAAVASPAAPTWTPELAGTVDRPHGSHPVLISTHGAILALAGPPGTSIESLRRLATSQAHFGLGVDRTVAVLERFGIPDDPGEARDLPDFSTEAAQAHSSASVAVRVALREELRSVLASSGRAGAGELRIATPEGPVGRTAPWAGTAAGPWPEIDISISHHGALIAFAWRVNDTLG